jgi:hypothetical protein
MFTYICDGEIRQQIGEDSILASATLMPEYRKPRQSAASARRKHR